MSALLMKPGPCNERTGGVCTESAERLSIARALLRNPQLVVLDEPTNNLDHDSVHALLDILTRLKGQTTLLSVSHDSRIVRVADRGFRLDTQKSE